MNMQLWCELILCMAWKAMAMVIAISFSSSWRNPEKMTTCCFYSAHRVVASGTARSCTTTWAWGRNSQVKDITLCTYVLLLETLCVERRKVAEGKQVLFTLSTSFSLLLGVDGGVVVLKQMMLTAKLFLRKVKANGKWKWRGEKVTLLNYHCCSSPFCF